LRKDKQRGFELMDAFIIQIHHLKTEIVKLRNDAANEIERLRNNQSILITSFRVNMMRLCPEYSHEKFDEDIVAMLKEKE